MRFIFAVVVNLLFLFCSSNGQISDDMVVSLREPKSKIRGHGLHSSVGNVFYAFQDIPYAVPPVGEYRFTEPKPHPGWEGILNTTRNMKICVQDRGTGTEDCLVLNVYTPVRNSSAKLPVLFWIPGGAFQHGSAQIESNNPQRFIDHGIVIVTLNYRVGPFGFLTTEDGVIPGNLGLKDQVLALKWVNKNIEAFGGDPQKVTIAGQSAGSISVSFHILSRKSTGLYRAAIMESGTALTHGSYIDHARNYSFQLGRNIDRSFVSNDSKDLLKLLRKASVFDILNASPKVEKIEKDVGIEGDLKWAVVLEDKYAKNSLITEHMHSVLQSLRFDKVPILIGYTSEEMVTRIFDVDAVKQSAAFTDLSPGNLIHDKWHIDEIDRVQAGGLLKGLYTSKTFSEDLPAYVSFSSDSCFVDATVRQAHISSGFVHTYLYQFSYKGASHRKPVIPGVDGAGHAEELNYMWFSRDLTADDLLTSKRLVTMWSNFVKELNPTPTADSTLGLPVWPQVQPDEVIYLDIDYNVTLQMNPKKYFGVSQLFNRYMQAPYDVY